MLDRFAADLVEGTWSPEEEEYLIEELELGRPFEAISKALGRSPIAIQFRLAKLYMSKKIQVIATAVYDEVSNYRA